MDIIQLLPDSVANQIAAGEVIQRPASVIKELVENAIDAGAGSIQVLVCDAGKNSIQVIDDGKGMSEADARLSFERHATSKIRQAQDLFSLHTMGFRGEALASIAAVAQVTLQTRTAGNEVGTRIVIAGSRVQSQEPIACPIGSNFLVENLFYNIPARRKFLKSNATEMSNITQAFERIALVYPGISFSLSSNGQETMRLHPGNMHQRIAEVFGKRVSQQLLPLEAQTTICGISGFVGKPECAKKKGALQYFFVNGRYMKHPYFHKAVQTAYDRLVPEGEQVSYFIHFSVNPEDIDVNIHPVKTEIKFDNEQAIWQILMAAVRDAVGRFSDTAYIDFDTEGKPEIPVFNPNGTPFLEPPTISVNPRYNPFDTPSSHSSPPHPSAKPEGASARGWEELLGGGGLEAYKAPKQGQLFQEDDTAYAPRKAIEALQAMPEGEDVFQYRASYIVTQVQSGLMLIDQHRASQCVLFEQFMRSLETRTSHTQKVLFPEVVQFPPSYASELGRILEELRALGFDMTDLGGGSYAVAGIPAGLGGLDAVALVSELVAEAVECKVGRAEQVHAALAASLARRAATPYGEILNTDEMRNLLAQLSACKSQRYTPDGKPVIVIVEHDELERRFR